MYRGGKQNFLTLLCYKKSYLRNRNAFSNSEIHEMQKAQNIDTLGYINNALEKLAMIVNK